MTPTDISMHVYDFGQKKIWPKPALNTPWDAMRAYHDLQESVKRLADYSGINGRIDHYVKNLDTLAYALQEALFQTMVIRETLTGYKTRAESEASR